MGLLTGRRAVGAVAASGLAAGLLTITGSTAAFAATCPTVDPLTHAVSPPPASGADWIGCDLTDANLAGADLDHAQLTSANLTGADLSGANLTAATVWSANLAGADVSGTVFTSARFYRVASGQLTGIPADMPATWSVSDGYVVGPTANLSNANLAGAAIGPADLQAAELGGANLTGADLAGANLAQVTGIANLTSANLSDADLVTANLGDDTLTGADLADADLEFALLSGVTSGQITGTPASRPVNWGLAGGYLIGPQANLAGASLSGLDLAGADLSGASLTGANLTGSDLDEAQLTSAAISGALLAGADLDGVESGGVTGPPASLPANWTLLGGYLLGPKANLIYASLDGYDLSGLDLAGVYSYYSSFTSANFDGADLAGATFNDGTNLTGATFSGADLSGTSWSDTTCPDGTNSDKHIDGCFSALDTTPPVLAVTGVRSGHSYAIGSGVTPGCQVTDEYSPVIVGPTLSITSRSAHGLGVFTARCSGAQDRAGLTAAPVSVSYYIAYGFGGYQSPQPGDSVRKRDGTIAVVFGLAGASGRSIPAATGAALARAHHVRVTLSGPGIAPVRAACGWHRAQGGYFRCVLRIPGRTRTGRSHRYLLTAQEDPGFGFVLAPGEPTAVNPLVVHFR